MSKTETKKYKMDRDSQTIHQPYSTNIWIVTLRISGRNGKGFCLTTQIRTVQDQSIKSFCIFKILLGFHYFTESRIFLHNTHPWHILWAHTVDRKKNPLGLNESYVFWISVLFLLIHQNVLLSCLLHTTPTLFRKTSERMGTSSRCNDFWDRFGGQELVMIGLWLPLYTINQSQLTLVDANSPRSTETKNKVVVVVVILSL